MIPKRVLRLHRAPLAGIIQFMDRQLILDLKDITSVGIRCPRCGSQSVLDLTNKRCQAPGKCGSCGDDFYKGILENHTPFDDLFAAIKQAKASAHHITFHLAITPLQA